MIADHFWDNVDTSGSCWIWQRARRRMGGKELYGHLYVGGGRDGARSKNAHVFAYESYYGTVPNGLHVDHLCRNTLCVNPLHLEAVTIAENVLRGVGPSAREARQTRCLHGHPLSGENLYMCKRGKRHCRACRTRRMREFYDRKGRTGLH